MTPTFQQCVQITNRLYESGIDVNIFRAEELAKIHEIVDRLIQHEELIIVVDKGDHLVVMCRGKNTPNLITLQCSLWKLSAK